MLGIGDSLTPGLLSLLWAGDSVVKFGLHADNMKFRTHNKD
jgi:hypothetical protein